MNLLGWVVFGMLVALIANIVNPRTNVWGLLNDIAMGIGGAVLGGLIWSVVLQANVSGFDITSLVLALLGALALLLTERRLERT